MAVLASTLLLILLAGQQHGRCSASGLVDNPIAAATIQYLDGRHWTAELLHKQLSPTPSSSTPLLSIPATVPGDVITDLQAAGKVGDPLFELNFKNASLWDTPESGGLQWVYSTQFTTTINEDEDDVHVVLDGVKMGATVSLNGHELGQVTDQFLRYEFDVTGLLLPKSTAAVNSLKVCA